MLLIVVVVVDTLPCVQSWSALFLMILVLTAGGWDRFSNEGEFKCERGLWDHGGCLFPCLGTGGMTGVILDPEESVSTFHWRWQQVQNRFGKVPSVSPWFKSFVRHVESAVVSWFCCLFYERIGLLIFSIPLSWHRGQTNPPMKVLTTCTLPHLHKEFLEHLNGCTQWTYLSE